MPLYSDKHITDTKFRQSLLKYSVKPSWRGWLGISNKLGMQAQNSSARKLLIAALILVMISSSVGLFEVLHKTGKSNHSDQSFTKQYSLVQASEINPKADFTNTNSEVNTNGIHSEMSEVRSAIGQSAESNKSRAEAHINSAEENSYPESMPPLCNLSLSYSSDDNLAQKSGTSAHLMRGYIGVTTLLNSTWLVDEQAISSEYFKYKFTTGFAYGIQGGYLIGKHWGVQAAWLINSWQGQHYKNKDIYERTTSLEYQNKSISLTYVNFPLLLEYRMPKESNIFHSASLNVMAGVQYGRLISYRVNGVKGELQSDDLIKSSDFAVVTGVDYDFLTERPVFFTVGLRTSLGSNIFNEDVPNDFEFENPRNFLIGIHGAINFSLDKNGFVK